MPSSRFERVSVVMGALLGALAGASLQASEPWLDYSDVLDEPRVLEVKLRRFRNEYWSVVTLHHDDTGHDHFLDWYVVVDDRNRLIQKRFIEKPTPGSWPIKVASRGIRIPDDVRYITFKAHCKLHGLGPATVTVDLFQARGPDWEIVPDVRRYISRPGFVVKYFRKEAANAIDWYW